MGKSNTKKKVVVMGKVNLDRFAGSSDDDDDVEDDVESDQEEDEVMKAAAGGGGGRHDDNADVEDDESDADDSSDNDEGAQVENENDDDTDNDDIPPDEFVVDSKTKASSSKKGTTTSTPKDDEDDDSSSMEGGGTEHDPSSRMADAMGKILGTLTTTKSNKKGPSTVVLAKTVTPLQKLQQQEKEKQRQMTEKRQASRERNLSALHLPRSIATTNNVFSDGQQQLSVVKELEQERYHRRVATRGVVALFNAISQHQRTGGHTEVCRVYMCVWNCQWCMYCSYLSGDEFSAAMTIHCNEIIDGSFCTSFEMSYLFGR